MADATTSTPAVPLLMWQRRTAVSGLVATAVAFGPARMAFGMLLPDIRSAFDLSASAAGLIASAGFAAFALALVAASLLTRRFGAKLPIVAGGLAALGGAAIVALAPNAPVLGAGVVLATVSSGLCWTPFNAVAGRLVRPSRRNGVLSVVSTGSTVGIVLMALGALALSATDASWRWVWIATAVGGAVAAGLSFAALPPSGRLVPRRPPDVPELDARGVLRRLAKPEARPIYAAALAFGAVSAAFSTFAVDHLATAPARTEPRLALGGLVFLAYGLLGLAGFAAAAIERRLGLFGAMALCFAVAATGIGALALAPGSLPLALIGAGAVGANVMVFSVLLSVAGLRLFPALPVMGFTVAVVATSIGSIAGPILTGALADASGTGAALLAGAALSAVAAGAVLLPGRAARAGTASESA